MSVNQEDQFIIINFKSKLPIGRGAIEDDLDEVLEELGEVSGGGSGIAGSTIIIDIYEGKALDYLELIIQALKKWNVPSDTEIVIEKTIYFLK